MKLQQRKRLGPYAALFITLPYLYGPLMPRRENYESGGQRFKSFRARHPFQALSLSPLAVRRLRLIAPEHRVPPAPITPSGSSPGFVPSCRLMADDRRTVG